jgi:hypothetical protein
MVSYNPGGADLPAPGGDYNAPTPHAANSEHTPFTAPTSLPSDNPAAPSTAAFDVIEAGLGNADQL